MAQRPITWQNINAPDLRTSGSLLASGNEALSGGFDRLTGLGNQLRKQNIADYDKTTALNTENVLNQLSQLSTLDEYDAVNNSGDFSSDALRKRFGNQINVDAVTSALANKPTDIRSSIVNKLKFDDTVNKKTIALNTENVLNQLGQVNTLAEYDAANNSGDFGSDTLRKRFGDKINLGAITAALASKPADIRRNTVDKFKFDDAINKERNDKAYTNLSRNLDNLALASDSTDPLTIRNQLSKTEGYNELNEDSANRLVQALTTRRVEATALRTPEQKTNYENLVTQGTRDKDFLNRQYQSLVEQSAKDNNLGDYTGSSEDPQVQAVLGTYYKDAPEKGLEVYGQISDAMGGVSPGGNTLMKIMSAAKADDTILTWDSTKIKAATQKFLKSNEGTNLNKHLRELSQLSKTLDSETKSIDSQASNYLTQAKRNSFQSRKGNQVTKADSSYNYNIGVGLSKFRPGSKSKDVIDLEVEVQDLKDKLSDQSSGSTSVASKNRRNNISQRLKAAQTKLNKSKPTQDEIVEAEANKIPWGSLSSYRN
jgi:hypothetical protein